MKVLIVDDHRLFADAMRNLLEAGGVTVAGTAKNGAEALIAAREHRPDLVLMDINMPDCDGLAATRQIKTEFPDMKIVMLTMNMDDETLLEAIRCGASGFLLKNMAAEELFACLERLDSGEAVFSPGLAVREPAEFGQGGSRKSAAAPEQENIGPLTPRQEEVLILVARGLTYKDVALALHISEATVKYHMNEILDRLQVDTRAQAIAYISRSGRT